MKWPLRILLMMAGALVLLLGCSSSERERDVSDHFDGKRFFNPGFDKNSSVAGYLRLRLTESQPDWPESVPLASQEPVARVPGTDSLKVTMIGHATLLIEMGDFVILTDPIWSERASPISFAGPRRIVEPAIDLEELPPIDLVLISHNHYDHLDLKTLQQLDTMHAPRVVVPLGNLALVSNTMAASKVTEHDWGDRIEISDAVSVSVEPVLHGSGRSPFDQQHTLWAGYVVASSTHSVFFVGDAGFRDGQYFKKLGEKFKGIDIIALPIGAYAPAWFMRDAHMSPAEAVDAFQLSGARYAIGHHFDTFQLGFEGFGAAAALISQTVDGNKALEGRFHALKTGEVFEVLADK